MLKSIGKPKEAMKKRHKMCRFEFLEPKNKIHNNQPQIRVGKPFAVVAACWKWVSMAIVASKKDRQLSLAFLRVRRRSWLKMSGSPMGKLGYSREVFDFLPVARDRPATDGDATCTRSTGTGTSVPVPVDLFFCHYQTCNYVAS